MTETMTKVSDVIKAIEAVAPLRYQDEWDNSGLQVGFPNDPADKVLVCLDVTEALRRHLSDGKVTFMLVREAREYGDDRDNYKKVAVVPSKAELMIW